MDKDYIHRYYQAHAGEIAEKKRLYREAHAGELAEKGRRYREAHAGELAEKRRRYREAHAGELAEKRRRYYQAHAGELAEKKIVGKLVCSHCRQVYKKSDYPHYCSRNCYLEAFRKYRPSTSKPVMIEDMA